MYLHLGQDTVVAAESIVGIFDIDKCTVSKKTRDYLAEAEKDGRVTNVSYELPRSFVVCRQSGKLGVYICQLSPKTLVKRLECPPC